MNSDIPQVALLLETSTSWGSEVVRGIVAYVRENGPWQFFLEPRGLYERLSLPTGWMPDGVIARVLDQEMAQAIGEAGIPSVNVSWTPFRGERMARCTIDHDAVGEMAASTFLDRGLRHVGYIGPERARTLDHSPWQAFESKLKSVGVSCSAFAHTGSGYGERQTWVEKIQALGAWLEQQPKPMGLLAFRAMEARMAADACLNFAIRVPEQVAILSAEVDDLTASIATPPLSSIDIGGSRLGYRAAALLANMMQGQPAPSKPILLPPQGIIARQSTDVMMIDDVHLSHALQFIRENYDKPITVESIVEAVNISRRALEQRFKQILGRLPADEIRRVRLEQAVRLLFDTRMPISQIAESCGFNHSEVMGKLFRRTYGMSPSAYRRKLKGEL